MQFHAASLRLAPLGAGAVHPIIGRLRDECLNETIFTSLAQARAVLAAWRLDYNSSRPHSALGYATPQEFAASQQGHAPAEMTPAPTTGTNQQPGLSG